MTLNNIISIKPFLTVNDGKKALNFYISAFCATEKSNHELPNGKLSTELAIENAYFFIGDEDQSGARLQRVPT